MQDFRMDYSILAKEEYVENPDLSKQIKKEEDIFPKEEEIDIHTLMYSQRKDEASSDYSDRLNFQTKVEFDDEPPLNGVKRRMERGNNEYNYKRPFKIVRDLSSKHIKKEAIVSENPIVNVKMEPEKSEEGDSHHESEKKVIRVSACKNYIGLLCAGFSRAILSAERSSPIIVALEELIDQRKIKFDSCKVLLTEKLMESFKTYIYKSICGKKVKKCNQERDFKIRNSHELDSILMIKQRDSEQTCLRKEVLKEMIIYFFDSDYYYNWLSKGMISEGNKIFFIKNKKEIQKKFLNPAFYKPKFNHNQEEQEEEKGLD